MKTREQLIEEIIQELGYGGDLTFETVPEIINKVVETCEEAVNQELSSIFLSKHIDHATLVTMNFLAKHMRENILENLKKLKSR